MSSSNPVESERHGSSLKPVIQTTSQMARSPGSNRGRSHTHGSSDGTPRKDASNIKLSKQELKKFKNQEKEQEYLVEIINECATIALELHWESLENWKKLVKDVEAIEHYSLEDDEVTHKKKDFLASYMKEIENPYKLSDTHVNHPFYNFFRTLNISKVDLSTSELKAFRDALVASRPEKRK